MESKKTIAADFNERFKAQATEKDDLTAKLKLAEQEAQRHKAEHARVQQECSALATQLKESQAAHATLREQRWGPCPGRESRAGRDSLTAMGCVPRGESLSCSGGFELIAVRFTLSSMYRSAQVFGMPPARSPPR